MSYSYPRYYNKNDFAMGVSATSITTIAGQYTQIGYHQVGAKQINTFGVGNANQNFADTRMTATIKIYSLGAQVTAGTLRLVNCDANLIQQYPVHEDLLSNWSTGVKVEQKSMNVGEDGYLKIFVNTTASHVLDFSNTSTQCDVPVVVTAL